MANIDNLNFEVILKDDDFEKKVNEDIALAEKLNASLSTLLDLQSKIKSSGITAKATNDSIRQQKLATAIANTATAETRLNNARENGKVVAERLATAVANRANAESRATRAALQTEQAQRRIASSVNSTNMSYLAQSRILNSLKTAALSYFSIQGASQLLSSLVKVTGEFELQKTTLSAMLGDLDAAENILTRIKGLAVESPFQFKELATYTKQLSAFAVPAEELYNTTKMLADISAGLGVGMDRIVLAYGQVRSAAFLRGQEVRQFTEAGIPILDELAKQFTELEGRAVSAGEVFDKISARLVPFEMVAKVFKDMTSEGGKFYNMQEVQAETLKGKISNLKDAYEMMLNEIGEGQSENLKGAVDWAKRLMTNYEQTGRVLVELIATYGVYKATLLAVEGVTKTFTLANHKLISALISAGKYLLTNPYVAVTAVIAGLGYAAYKSATYMEGFEKIQKRVAETQEDFSKDLSKETAKLDALYANLKLAKKGTEEYNNAKKEIYSRYASYISQLRSEGVEVNDLATIYDNLKTKIEEATRARTSSKAQQKLTETYDQEIDSYYDRYIKIITKAQRDLNRQSKNGYAQFSEYEKAGFWKFLTGSMNMGDLERAKGLERVVNVLNNATIHASADLKLLRGEVVRTTKQYNKSLKEIKAAYGENEADLGNLNPFQIPYPGDKSEAQKRIESQIALVKKLQDAYEELRPFLNDEQLSKTLAELFPNAQKEWFKDFDFSEVLRGLARQLASYDPDAAESLRNAVSKDVAAGFADAFKNFDTYKQLLNKWRSMDFALEGKGVYLDMSKIIRDLNNEYARIDEERLKALKLLNKAQLGDEQAKAKVIETYGQEVWDTYIKNGSAAIDELVRKEKEGARQVAYEKSRDLAKKYVAEMDIDLSGLQKKTTSQIKGILKSLEDEITKVEKEIGQALVAAFSNINGGEIAEEAYAKWQMLIEVLELLRKQAEETQQSLDEKNWRKASKAIDMLSKGFSRVGSDLSSLGSQVNNDILRNFGDRMSDLGELVENVSTNLKTIVEDVGGLERINDIEWSEMSDAAKGGVIGIVVGAVMTFYNSILRTIESVYESQRLLNEASREYIQILNEDRREQHSDIWGTDEIALTAENLDILNEAQERYLKLTKTIDKEKFQGYLGGSNYTKTSVREILEDISSMQGWNLYDQQGEIDIDALATYYDSFKKSLTRKQQEVVKELIDAGKQLDDAAAQQAEYLTNLFSGVADDIATSMVDAFLESGDAAADFGDIAKNVAKEMAIDLVKSVLLKPILDEYGAAMKYIMSQEDVSYEDKLKELSTYFNSMLVAVGQVSEDATEMLKPLLGSYVGGAEEASSFVDGIKGVTEDTAGLLASYMNAMRADLSAARQLQAIHLPVIGAAMPTIMDHLAQINAHTFDMSRTTDLMLTRMNEIYSRLDGVITSEGGPSAIRILS